MAAVARRPLMAWCAAGAGLAFAVTANTISWSATLQVRWLEPLLRGWGALAIAVGLVLWLRLPAPRIGQLVLATGSLYYLGDLRVSDHPVVFAIGFCLAYLWTAVLGHLVLVWPTGRVTGRFMRVLVPFCYLAAVGTQVIRFIVDRPKPPWWYGSLQINTTWAKVGSLLLVALVLVVVGVMIRRWATSTRLKRRSTAPVWGVFLLTAVFIASAGVASVFGVPVTIEQALILAGLFSGGVGVLVALLIRTLRFELARLTVTRAVLDIERSLTSQDDPALQQRVLVQQVLADALGDPTLRLAYPAEDGSYVDIDGRPVELRSERPGRVVTPVRRRGRLLGLIEHDEALNEQRKVAEAAVTVAGIAFENAYLDATLRKQLEQIRTSRLRLSTAAFEERHRIQRDLHDGAQQQLFAVLVRLGVAQHALAGSADAASSSARSAIEQAHAQLKDAIHSLRQLTHGIYPTVLIEHGLAAAVEGLADVSPIPVSFEVPDTRWPRHVEITAYFVVAEALTNAHKHAAAGRVDVVAGRKGNRFVIEVTDDGRGGADPTIGTGLTGLKDRVAAVGGDLTITDAPGRGTRIIADIPMETP